MVKTNDKKKSTIDYLKENYRSIIDNPKTTTGQRLKALQQLERVFMENKRYRPRNGENFRIYQEQKRKERASKIEAPSQTDSKLLGSVSE